MSWQTEPRSVRVATSEAAPRRHRRRWLLAAGILFILVAAAVGLRMFPSSSSPAAATVTPTPTSAAVTAAGTPNCAPRLAACGYPDASTTGVRVGVATKTASCPEITEAGQVVEAVVLIDCPLSVGVPDVVIRDVRLTVSAPDSWAIIVRPGGSARIEHVEISGTGSPEGSVEYAVLSLSSQPVSIDHANLHGCQDCIQGDHLLVTNSYIHDLANPPGAHVDGVLCTSGCGITVRHNTVVNEHTQTSAVGLFADFAAPLGSVVEDNFLVGGGYTVYAGGPTAKGNAFINNRFARSVHAEGGEWGPVTAFEPSGNTWSGNVWDDSLQSVG
jgi:hypothetical protein